MGLFKQMKDMKNVVEQAPDMINQAQQLGAQAQEMGAAPRREASTRNVANPEAAHAAAAAAGIEAADWDAAVAGWGQRMQGGTAVGQRFNQLYQGA